MPTQDTLKIVRTYHNRWTTKQFDQEIGLLSPNLVVEVPINDYPTTSSFADAVSGFGSRVRRITPSELGHDEAMLLYERGRRFLGTMRIVEHFTVANGKIGRIRQIHDTAALPR